MSLGYGEPSAVVRSALQDALDHGIVVVASSGNSGNSAEVGDAGQAPYSFPADYPGVLGVAAVSRSGSPAGFSSDNLSVQVAAPGVNVPAQGRDGQYWLVSGTSPACALTAGVAALIKARYPGLAPALVVQAITSSTQNRPSGGYDNKIGFGTVDAAGRARPPPRRRPGPAARPGRRGHHAALRRRRRGRAGRRRWRPRGAARAGRGGPVRGWLSWPRPAWPGGGWSACAGPCPAGSTPRTGRRSRSGPVRRFRPPGRTGRTRARGAEQAVGSADPGSQLAVLA